MATDFGLVAVVFTTETRRSRRRFTEAWVVRIPFGEPQNTSPKSRTASGSPALPSAYSPDIGALPQGAAWVLG